MHVVLYTVDKDNVKFSSSPKSVSNYQSIFLVKVKIVQPAIPKMKVLCDTFHLKTRFRILSHYLQFHNDNKREALVFQV